MKNNVHIINAMEIGGVEVGVLSLLKSERNSDYKVIAVKGCDKNLYKSLTEDERTRLYICNGFLTAFLLILKIKPDTVISSLWRAHFVSLIYKIFRPGIKRIHFVHSARFAHFLDEIITRASVLISDFVFCDSKQSKLWLEKVTGYSSSLVVPMNVSFSNKKKSVEFKPLRFVFVGRFCKEKNLLKAINFIEKLNLGGLHATFDLYGRDDGELNFLKDYVCKKEIDDFVSFHESLLPTDIESEMRKYNYYLQTSLVEGMAISVFQSIKNGLLPVITPVGEIVNYTKNGFNAFYLNAENIDKSADEFKRIILSDEIKNFRVGTFVNKDDYPDYAKSFFNAIERVI